MKTLKTALSALSALACLAAATPALATPLLNNPLPLITAGAPPDSPAAHVDPNTAASAFSGVVSVNIRYMENGSQLSFICSGTLVSKRHVVTAGHCVDTTGNGNLIDLNAAGQDVRVVFNSSDVVGDPGRAIVTATGVSMHSDYAGFGNCPAGVSGFCVNDDVAVVTLGQDAPDSARIYRTFTGDILSGQLVTLVGYGTSGDGINGFNIGPSFRIKRDGENVIDFFENDDEQNFMGGPNEVWYADFDGNGRDIFCELGIVCSQVLPNDRESGIGGGDSGGPTFLYAGGEYFLIGNNTFGGNFPDTTAGAFGSYFGGMLLGAYWDYLRMATNGQIRNEIPEPQTFALALLALAAVAGARRQRR